LDYKRILFSSAILVSSQNSCYSEIKRERGEGGMRVQNGFSRHGFRVRSLASASINGSRKRRQQTPIRRPFHPAVKILCMYNPGEKGAETSSSQVPTVDHPPLLFTEPAVPLGSICSSTSHALANVVNALPVASYLRYLLRCFVSSPSAAPTASLGSAFLASRGCRRVHFGLDEP
jgi:hypothetical protein